MKNPKIIYIAHPISGDVAGNLEKIRQIIRTINLEEPEVVPFAPYFADCYALDDSIPEERKRGIKNNIRFFNSGIIDEVRLYGSRVSKGMEEEMKLAQKLNINVKRM